MGINAPGFFSVWGAFVLLGLATTLGYGPERLLTWLWPTEPKPRSSVQWRRRALESLPFVLVTGLIVAALAATLAIGLRHI
jgi:hypothetical protein